MCFPPHTHKPTTMTWVIAFDFETAGGVPTVNGFAQFGAALVSLETKQVEAKFESYASMHNYQWDEQWVRKTWKYYPDHFDETKRITERYDTPDPFTVMEMFWKWVDSEVVSKGIAAETYLITDNSAFDAGLLRAFSKQDPLYILGEYRDIVDVSSYYLGSIFTKVDVPLLDENTVKLAFSIFGEKDAPEEAFVPEAFEPHPVSNAMHMAQRWAWFMGRLKKQAL